MTKKHKSAKQIVEERMERHKDAALLSIDSRQRSRSALRRENFFAPDGRKSRQARRIRARELAVLVWIG